MKSDLEITNWANTMKEIADQETIENYWVLITEKRNTLRDKFVPKNTRVR